MERALFAGGVRSLAAVDEVGRGALAGPVTVGVVTVTAGLAEPPAGLRDSKLLSPVARERLVEPITTWVTGWAIGHAAPGEVDRFGIIGALRLAALRALAALPSPVDAVLLDGNFDYLSAPSQFDTPVTTRVKGDRDCASVAAASVLAKVTRDALMAGLHEQFPQYGWAANKGYGTGVHGEAIRVHGPCEHHRRSWNLAGRGAVAQPALDGE